MPILSQTPWLNLAIYAVIIAGVLFGLFRIPKIGPFIRGAFSFAMLALFVFVLLRQAPFDPTLSQITERLGLNDQQVQGETLRIRMSSDGHFWATARINGVERRMLIDSGATVTALSSPTTEAAGVEIDAAGLPVIMRTASGVVTARTGSIDQLSLGGIEARNLKIVSAPGLGGIDVLGMNFLSQLASWRVEGRTLILTPKAAAPEPAAG